MTRNLLKAVAVLLWLVVGALALEAYESIHLYWLRPKAKQYVAEARARVIQTEVQRATESDRTDPPPPHDLTPSPDCPPRQDYLKLNDDDAKKRFVTRRGEFVMECTREGTIAALYASPQPREIALLAGEVHPGASVTALVASSVTLLAASGKGQGPDCLNAIDTVYQTGMQNLRDYTLALPDGARYLAEFVFIPRMDAAKQVQSVLVFVRESTWADTRLTHRPHIYRNDSHAGIVWTNRFGFRDREPALPKPPGVYRILCIGGSTTFEGARNTLTYPAILQQKLRAHFKTEQIEVFNCGVVLLDSRGEKENMPLYLSLQPDLIIHYNFANDSFDAVCKTYEHMRTSGTPLDRVKLLLRRSLFIYSHFGRWVLPPIEDYAYIIEKQTIPNLRAIVTAARAHNVPVAFCSFACPALWNLPAIERAYFQMREVSAPSIATEMYSYAKACEAYAGCVRNLCEQEGAYYVPVAEHFNAGATCFSDTCHMYLNGMERKADIILDTLKDYIAKELTRRGAS